MRYRIRLEPAAVDELEQAYDWLERQSPTAAQDWLKGLMEAIDSLDRFPRRCPVAPESAHVEYQIRQLLYGRGRSRYRILFHVKDDVVDILHIRHGARAWLEPSPPDD